MSINRVNISGNLTRDPEMRATAAGTQILTFRVAVNDRRRNPQTGEWEDYPNYIDCVVFGNRAEALSRFLSKGAKVALEGKLRWSQWERDGQNRSKIEVIVDEVEFLSPRNQQGQGGYQPQGQGGYQPPQQVTPAQAEPTYSAPQQTYTSQPPVVQATPPSAELYDEEIPF